MNAELAKARKAREARRKLVDACAALVAELEAGVCLFLEDVDKAEAKGTMGRERAGFQKRATQLHEQGTLAVLKVDAIQSSAADERDIARGERKALVARIQACSSRCAAFL